MGTETFNTVEDLIEAINEATAKVMRWAKATYTDEGGFRRYRWADGTDATLEQALARYGRHPAMHRHLQRLAMLQTILVNIDAHR